MIFSLGLILKTRIFWFWAPVTFYSGKIQPFEAQFISHLAQVGLDKETVKKVKTAMSQNRIPWQPGLVHVVPILPLNLGDLEVFRIRPGLNYWILLTAAKFSTGGPHLSRTEKKLGIKVGKWLSTQIKLY